MTNQKSISVLFVCLGNICRSPTAEAVFKRKVVKSGLENFVRVDSAGTSGWHIDSPPDSRTIKAASLRGYDMSLLRGREVTNDDFECFDYIFAMDKNNLRHLDRMRSEFSEVCASASKIVSLSEPVLFLGLVDQSIDEVPDPYHGDAVGFEYVLDLVEKASDVLLEKIKKELVL